MVRVGFGLGNSQTICLKKRPSRRTEQICICGSLEVAGRVHALWAEDYGFSDKIKSIDYEFVVSSEYVHALGVVIPPFGWAGHGRQ
jgi:hypothetical protein